jgi:hypothetical protein
MRCFAEYLQNLCVIMGNLVIGDRDFQYFRLKLH